MSSLLPTRPGGTARGVTLAFVGFVAAGLFTALFVGLARDTGERLLSPMPATAAELLVGALAVVGAVLTTWLGLGVVAAALTVVPGAVGRASRSVAETATPLAVRRGVAVLLGTALVASFSPGAAVGSPSDPVRPRASSGPVATTPVLVAPAPDLRPDMGSGAPDPSLRPPSTTASPTASTAAAAPAPDTGLGPLGPGPPRAALAPAARPAGAPDAGRLTAEAVVVRSGDTLWAIAAHHLGEDATAASIDAEWRRWYSVNLPVIGDDPDLIQPGQRLMAPPPLRSPRARR